MPSCQPGADLFIEKWFGDCIYSGRDMAGFAMGILSILCWLVAQVPQLVTNYRNQSADALSPFFLAEWLLGDTCNLVGALLQGDQVPTVVFTAQYFICMDVVLLVQFVYYTTLQRRRERLLARRQLRRHHRHRRHHHRQQLPQLAGEGAAAVDLTAQQQQQQQGDVAGEGACAAAQPDTPEVLTHADATPSLAAVGSSSGNGREFVFRPQRVAACVGLLFLLVGAQQQQPWQQQQQQQWGEQQALGALQPQGPDMRRLLVVGSTGPDAFNKMPSWAREVGTGIAFASSVLYLASRVSQIYKNWRRRSAEGLAMTMFLFAIAANTLYGLSIVVRATSLASLRSSAPWLIGSLGTVALDTTIFMQGLLYSTGEKKHGSDEEEALLSEHKH